MTYRGEGEVSASIIPTDGQDAVGGVTIIADSAATGGRYSLYQFDVATEAGGAAPHFHRTFAESFHVVRGGLELFDGTDWVEAGEGDHLFVPEGGIHGFRGSTGGPATLLMMSIPGAAREDYFAELIEVFSAGRELSAGEWTALYARHDQYMV